MKTRNIDDVVIYAMSAYPDRPKFNFDDNAIVNARYVYVIETDRGEFDGEVYGDSNKMYDDGRIEVSLIKYGIITNIKGRFNADNICTATG